MGYTFEYEKQNPKFLMHLLKIHDTWMLNYLCIEGVVVKETSTHCSTCF